MILKGQPLAANEKREGRNAKSYEWLTKGEKKAPME